MGRIDQGQLSSSEVVDQTERLSGDLARFLDGSANPARRTSCLAYRSLVVARDEAAILRDVLAYGYRVQLLDGHGFEELVEHTGLVEAETRRFLSLADPDTAAQHQAIESDQSAQAVQRAIDAALANGVWAPSSKEMSTTGSS